MLWIANHKPCSVDSNTTVSMSMYEIAKFVLYKFTASCCYLQVYSISDSLQQIVATYKSLTN